MSDDELPDINVTRGEKALAAVLTIFLVIGALWVYFVALPRDDPYDQELGNVATAQQRQAIDAAESARGRHRPRREHLRHRKPAHVHRDARAPHRGAPGRARGPGRRRHARPGR